MGGGYPPMATQPAAVRFLSCEPLIGAVDLRSIDLPGGWNECFPLGQHWLDRPNVDDDGGPLPFIDWVICGGESGPGARPMHPDWARALRDQCAAAGVPFFFKQWGEWVPAGLHLEEDSPEYLRLRRGDRAHVFLPDHQQMAKVGKKRAGRLLDGVQHDGMPMS